MAVSKIFAISTCKTSISDLPELPMLTIFDFIPLPNLVHIDEVCRAWQRLKPDALNRRRHLIIANGPADLEELAQPGLDARMGMLRLVLEEDGTPLVKLKMRLDCHALFIVGNRPFRSTTFLNRLIGLLPNLKVFRYVRHYGCCEELETVKRMLTHYRRQLVEVTIFCWGKPRFVSGQVNHFLRQNLREKFISLLTSLNRLSALRSLELSFRAAPGCPVDLDDYQLFVNCLPDLVGRLTKLNFNTCSEYDGVIDRYASDARPLKAVLFRLRDEKNGVGGGDKAVLQSLAGSKLKSQQQLQQQQLQLKVQKNFELYVDNTPLTLKTLILLGPGPVAAGLRTVEIDGIFSANSAAKYKALAQLARQSPHLQALTVSLEYLSIRQLVESLASLKELIFLCINCETKNPPRRAKTVNACRLPSVRSLRLNFLALSHHNYEQLHLEVHFPNLQTVFWNHLGWSCLDCGYLISLENYLDNYRGYYLAQPDARQFQADYGRQMTTCLRLARQAAFSRLPKLTHLYLTVRPSQVYLPFKDQLFTNCRVSLNRQTEFVERDTESPNSSKTVVFYND